MIFLVLFCDFPEDLHNICMILIKLSLAGMMTVRVQFVRHSHGRTAHAVLFVMMLTLNIQGLG